MRCVRRALQNALPPPRVWYLDRRRQSANDRSTVSEQKQCNIGIKLNSVRFVGGVWGWLRFNPPLVDDDPPLVSGYCKFGLGVGFDPLRKVKNLNSSLNRKIAIN